MASNLLFILSVQGLHEKRVWEQATITPLSDKFGIASM